MPQKRRKASSIVSFLLDNVTLKAIDQRVEELAQRSRKAALSRSGWIKRAIQRDLHHDVRSRRKRVTTAIHSMAGTEEAGNPGVAGEASSAINNPAATAGVGLLASQACDLHRQVSGGMIGSTG